MIELLLPFGISLAVTALGGLLLIPVLRRLKFGQSIREEGPKWHMSKQGTPTMGGLLFMLGITAAVLICGWRDMAQGRFGHLFILVFALIFGAIGFIDDFYKVVRKQNLGLTAAQKLLLQLSVSAAFIALLRYFGYLTPNLYIPFLQTSIHLPLLLYAVISLMVVAGMVNAVNFTDGVDGLCSGVTLPIAVFFAVLGTKELWDKTELSIFAAALAGGLIGFLIYNFHPAKVFMGDTGSLFLGGAVCGLGFVFDAPLLIIIVGAVYIMEMLSVMLQVVYFKLTKGKRLFRMSPIHHHFEMGGWGEKKIFFVFMGITALMCILAYFAARGRYPGLY